MNHFFIREKLILIIVLPIVLLITAGCNSEGNSSVDEDAIHSFEELTPELINPSSEYRTVPFAVWNGKVTREKIDRQLQELKDVGVGGVFIHPRWGMITEYLDSTWYELMEYTVKKGEEMDLKVWLYDENSFPSGFAGGHVAAEMPDAYKHGQGLKQVDQSQLHPDKEKKYALILKKESDTFIDITDDQEEYVGMPGEYYLYELSSYWPSERFGEFSYVDLIYPGVTEKFIEVTMPGYEQTVGKKFGGQVPGLFTDEPNIKPPMNEAIRYTPDLFDRFEERWGYKLQENLPSLFEETGEWRKVRHNYYQLVLQLFIDRWAKPWFEYTEKHNLKWTGHYWEHGWPNPQHGGDNMAMYAWHQVPGIDMLFNTEEERPDQFGNVRAVKELISVANQMGYTRTLSETYGAAGWEIRFEDLKRLGDWEFTLGVNLMNQHLAYMDIIGDRKHDFPQSFSAHNDWWPHYKVLNDYFGRLSAALSAGEQQNRILVIEPTTSAWMHYAPGAENTEMENIGNRFDAWIHLAEKRQLEYDLGCENIIKDQGDVQGKQVVINQRSYDVVILPPGTQNLDSDTWNLIKLFLVNGGILFSVADFPSYVDGNPTDEFAEYANRFEENWKKIEVLGHIPTSWYISKELIIDNPQDIKGKLFHQHRILDDGELLFMSNFDKTRTASGRFRVKGADLVYIDLLAGKFYAYPHQQNGQLLEAEFNIHPHGTILFFVADEKMDLPVYEPPLSKKEEVAVDEFSITRNKANTLALDYVDVFVDGHWTEDELFYPATQKIFQAHGFDANPWSVSVQYKSNIADRDTFGPGTGYKARFHFYVDGQVDINDPLQLAVEQPSIFDVYVNNSKVQPLDGEWWLDPEVGLYDISGLYRTGDNTIRLEVSPMSIYAELEPVYLIGDFALENYTQGWKIIPSKDNPEFGSWSSQGMPNYAGSVSYTATFNPDKTKKYLIELGEWFGTVASIEVNGNEVGIIGWKPYQLDISDFIVDGENTVTAKVYGSLKNLLGPHHNVTRTGIVTPWSWRYGPQDQPPGAQYDVLDYGLMEPFEIYQAE